MFGDGISLSFWLNGTNSAGCCEFRGGPYLESRYFGEGVGIAVRKGNDLLRQAFNWALFRLWENGRFTDLWLRYFPISPFCYRRSFRGVRRRRTDPESRAERHGAWLSFRGPAPSARSRNDKKV